MSWAKSAIEALQRGEDAVICPRGHSMEPRVHDGDTCIVVPASVSDVKPGDVVLCRVRGRDYLHLVEAVDQDRALIANNRGFINGWTRRVFGRLSSAKRAQWPGRAK